MKPLGASDPVRAVPGAGWRGIWDALPDLLLAAQFLLMWVDPHIIGARWLAAYVGLMIAEFIVIHSSVFLGHVALGTGDRRARSMAILLIAAFYSLFFLAISAAVGEWYYLFAFWLMIGNRLLGVLLGRAPDGEERSYLQRSWAAAMIFYLVGVFVTLLLPLPELGITSDIRDRYTLPGEGEWVENPHVALAFGFFYYTMVGWSELLGHRWFSGVRARNV